MNFFFLQILNFFFQKCSNIFNQIFFSPFFFSKVFKFTWKMRYVLNRKKNHIPDFSDFYFSSFGHFCTPIFDKFFTITIFHDPMKGLFHWGALSDLRFRLDGARSLHQSDIGSSNAAGSIQTISQMCTQLEYAL